jgi:predicted N-acetyltransferase YhbS
MSAPACDLRSLRPGDESAVGELWRRALGDLWPIDRERLGEVIGPCEAIVAERAGTVAGFVAARRVGSRGAIVAIAVDPAWLRARVGSQLLEGALRSLRRDGVADVTLGAGAGGYLWPGVPDNLPAANAFFDARGWSREEPVADLVGDVRGFRAPAAVTSRAAEAGVTFEVAQPEDAAHVLRLQERHFPSWTDEFRSALARPGGVLVGRGGDGRAVATCTLDDGADYPFSSLVGDRVGGVGAVGVDPAVRGRGIGLALVATGAEILAARGYERCFVGYTHLAEWYARLGFERWRTYRMGMRATGPSVFPD